MDGVVVKGGAKGDVDLSGLETRGKLSFDDSSIDGKVDLSAARIADKATFSKARLGEIDLHEARVGRRLVLDGAVITRDADFASVQVAARASSQGGIFKGDVDLHNAILGERLDLGGARFEKKLDLTRVQVADSLFLGNHSDDLAANSKLFGVVEIDGAKIGRGLWLAEAEFHAKLSVAGSTIGDELNLGSKDQHWATWPSRRHLDGFTYRALCSDPSAPGDECRPKAATESLKTWVIQERTVGPYEQLASALTKAGLYKEAAAIQFEAHEVERRASQSLRRIWLSVLRQTIGYGYHPEYLAIYAILLIAIGVVLINMSDTVRDNDLEGYGIFYTVDMFLPLVRLNERHYTDVDLEQEEQYYFYFLKIAGFVLGPAGIAGLLARL